MGSASLADGQGPGSPQDHGGLHVCHSCRWRFPNSHPSARQRRAHRRHCGKIDGFPLIPSHHEDGGRSDGEKNDANAGATAAPPDPHSGKISEVDLDRKKSLITSAGCTVETSCETGEGRKRSGPVGVYGVEALVEILSGNPVDPYADKTFEFPDVAHGKEIRGVDVVEHSKKLDEPPTTGTLASNVQGTRLFAEIGDNGGDASSLSPAASPLDTYVNETSAEEDENVLNEFLAEIELAVEERLRVGSNFNLESLSIEAQGVYAMDTETRLFKRNNSSEIGVLSNPTSDTCRQETAPIIDISMNLKTVSLESTHAEESDIDGKNSRLGSNLIVPVSFSENEMGANAENNVPDEALVETKSAAVERPWEEYNFRLESFLDGTGKGNDLIHAELRSLDRNSSSGIEVQPQLSNICGEEIGNQGTDTPMTLEEPNSEATVVQELDKDVESTSTLVINPLDRSVNGMSSKVVENLLDESLFETEPCLEEVPWEKTILEENSEDHSLPVFQLLQDLCQDAISDISREHFSSHEEIKSFFGMPVDEKTSFTAGDHLKDVHTGAIQSESVLSVSGKVNHEASKDQGLPEADTTLETAVTCVEFRPADPGLEELKLGNTLNEAVQNLVPFISCGQADGDYAELENEGSRTIENEADENKNIADEDNPADGEASHDLSDELTSEEGSTYSVFKFLIQAKGDKNDGHVDVENSGNDQDGASYHQESDKESILKQSDKMIDPEFTTDHFHLKSPCSQDGEECQVERNQSLTGSVSMLNGSSQTSSPVNMGSEVRNFISLEAWIDDNAGVDTNQEEEDEGSLSITGVHTLSKSDITEEMQQSRFDSVSVRHLRETVTEPTSLHRQILPSEAPIVVSQEYGYGGLNQNNDLRLSDRFVETLGTADNVTLTALSSGTRNSVLSEEPRRGNEEIVSSFGHRSEDRAGHFIPKKEDKAESFSLQNTLMDTLHRTDIIEAHLVSVSALSTRDPMEQPLQDLDAMAVADLKTQRSRGLQEPNLAKRAASVDHFSEISETLSDISPVDPQQSSTQARHSFPERQKGEILPKLESWSSGKLHTPLKSLLMEANNESKQETLNPLTKPPQATSGSWAPPEEAARASKQLNKGFAKREAQKEWNSPARLPSNQNDRRRIKGRPQWVPFLCCPSLN